MPKKIIIFSAEGETLDNIVLAAKEYGDVSTADGGSAELFKKNAYDLVFVNTPLPSGFGLDLAVTAGKSCRGLIIAAAAKHCDAIAEKIGCLNAFVLPKPFTRQTLLQTIRYVLLAVSSEEELYTENTRLEQKLQDTKLIDRAKCVLMEYLRISEADAHRQIQKRAMDMHVTRADIARDILKTYET